jgi:hypothetical protein
MVRYFALALLIGLVVESTAQAGVIKSQTVGNSKVTLSSSKETIVAGDNDITVAITDAKGKSKKATISSLSFNMPAMGSMPAMKDTAVLTPGRNPGEYRGKLNVEMRGPWRVVVNFKDERGARRVSFKVVAK